MGNEDTASIIIVKQIDEDTYPSVEFYDTNSAGYELYNGASDSWNELVSYSTHEIDIRRGSLEIYEYFDHALPTSGAWISCQPFIGESWAGAYADLPYPSPSEEEGTTSPMANYAVGMWHRGRIYTNLPVGNQIMDLRCWSNNPGYSIGFEPIGSLLVREVDVIADE